jgi:hypothetical protein
LDRSAAANLDRLTSQRSGRSWTSDGGEIGVITINEIAQSKTIFVISVIFFAKFEMTVSKIQYDAGFII